MSRSLHVEELRDNSSIEIGKLESGETLIGREPGTGITVHADAVSRQHGLFLRLRNHWLYKDLGSTNGSWINGVQLKKDQMRVVRAGDVLQLADALIRLGDNGAGDTQPQSITGFAALGGRSLLVFLKGEFLDEFPIPEFGRALVVGGSEADLNIDGDFEELPSLIIERRGEKICAFRIAKTTAVTFNEQEISELVSLKDGDVLRVGDYSVLLNDPTDAHLRGNARGVPMRNNLKSGETPTRVGRMLNDWSKDGATDSDEGSHAGSLRTAARLPFGQQTNELDLNETMAKSPEEIESKLGGFDRHPSARFAMPEIDKDPSEDLEDKVIIFIGSLVLLAILILIGWMFI